MFDFGNKKEIEYLNEVIAKLSFENIEKDKVVDNLIGEINKLSNKIKELEKELKNEKNEKEKWYNKCYESVEYKLGYATKKWSIKNDSGIEKTYFILEDIEYIDITKNIKKVSGEIKDGDNIYQITCFELNDELLTPEYLKEKIKNKCIPTYRGIPFRKMQDLYKIMSFLESENYTNYQQETNNIDFTDDIVFKDNKIYLYGYEVNDKNIKHNIKTKRNYILIKNTNVELYKTRNTLVFNNKEFKNVKELMKLIKEKCYKNKELLKQFL